MKPSTEIEGALSGALSLDSIHPASISALRFHIHKIALEVLGLSSNERRRKFIDKYPEGIQPMIRAECRRLYDQRRL